MQQLQALLPGMQSTLQRMKPADLVRMATQLEQVGCREGHRQGEASREEGMPLGVHRRMDQAAQATSDTSAGTCTPSPCPQISEQLLTLRQLLPTADVAALVAAHPPVLRMARAELEDALAKVRYAFPEASQVSARPPGAAG